MEGYEKTRLYGKILQGVGIGIGVIVSILIVKWHPVLIGFGALGVAMYFVGQYMRKV